MQIEQILINLIVNAIDQNQEKKDSWVKVFYKKEGDFVNLIVQDSGKGIIQDDLTKIFNPFYTTKEIGKGTGLGLSISRGIARDHGGDLNYKLIEGHTAFILSLPLKQTEIKIS
ncbi:ATP-binding protein [Bacteriovoracaceae bacterium]|nr:ATP-binding protein [Bacteriovoracaceae bacterium]